MLDALTYVLFGKPFRNINKPQLLNSITKKELVVEVEFSVYPDKYKIIRGTKPNVFEVYKNNNLINQSADVRDYQDIIEKNILKINYKSFCQVVVLGSASFIPFMQLAAAQRRAIIEDLLDLQVFTTMNVLLKEQIQENLDELNSVDTKVKLTQENIKLVKEHLREIASNNQRWIDQKNLDIVDLKTKITSSQNIMSHLNDDVADLLLTLGDHLNVKDKLSKLDNFKSQFEMKIELLRKEVKFLSDNDNCPTCKQNISEDFKCEAIDHKNTNIKELDNGLTKLTKSSANLVDRLKEINGVNTKITELTNSISTEKLNVRHWNEQINKIKKEIEGVKSTTKTLSGDKIIDLEKTLSLVTAEYNNIQEEKKVLSAAAVLLKDGGIKTAIINQYVPIINKLITKYLSTLDFFIQFELNNQFEETIKSRYRDDFSYSSFSEGEKQRIDLALLFTWRAIAKLRNSVSTNILILDEIFDSSMDSSGVDQLMSIIQQINMDSGVFIISHREQATDKFSKVIKFIKHKNFSQVSEDS